MRSARRDLPARCGTKSSAPRAIRPTSLTPSLEPCPPTRWSTYAPVNADFPAASSRSEPPPASTRMNPSSSSSTHACPVTRHSHPDRKESRPLPRNVRSRREHRWRVGDACSMSRVSRGPAATPGVAATAMSATNGARRGRCATTGSPSGPEHSSRASSHPENRAVAAPPETPRTVAVPTAGALPADRGPASPYAAASLTPRATDAIVDNWGRLTDDSCEDGGPAHTNDRAHAYQRTDESPSARAAMDADALLRCSADGPQRR